MNRPHFLLSLTTAVALLLTAFTPVTTPRYADDDTPYQTKTFSGIKQIRSETSGGSLTVEGGSGSETRVEMMVRGNNDRDRNLSKAELDERLRQYDIRIEKEGNTLVATARPRERNMDWKRGLSIGFRFVTPRQTDTDLKTAGGSIRLTNLNGVQNFRTSGGSLTLTDVQGDIKGQTSGGGIRADKCQQLAKANRMDLQTSGGGIEVSNSTGGMNLRTSGGSIKLSQLKGDVEAHTSGGGISGQGLTGRTDVSTSGGSIRLNDVAGSLEARTSAGSVEVDLVELGDYVKLSTTAGSVRAHMPLTKGMNLDLRGSHVEVPSLSRFDGDLQKDRVRGRVNGGGIPVEMTASAGSVSIN